MFGRFTGQEMPWETTNPYEYMIQACRYQRLVKISTAGEIEGEAAKSWENQQSKTYTLELDKRSGLKADDVAQALKQIRSPRSTAFDAELFASLFDPKNDHWVEVVSPEVIKFNLAKPYPPFLYLLTSPEFSIPKKATQAQDHETIPLSSFKDPAVNALSLKMSGKTYEIKIFSRLDQLDELAKTFEPDLLIGVPYPTLTNFLKKSPLKLAVGRFPNPLHFEFNQNKPIFENSEFRHDLSNFLFQITSNWAASQSRFKVRPQLLPPGVLPPDYYSQRSHATITEDQFSKKWGELLKTKGLKFWLNSEYTDESFGKSLVEALHLLSPQIGIEFLPIRQAKQKFSEDYYDVIAVDGGSFFTDPDSAIEIWHHSMGELFPFPGKPLIEKLNKLRFDENPLRRLENYSAAIKSFESESWITPVLNSYDPFGESDSIKTAENPFMPFDMICNSELKNK